MMENFTTSDKDIRFEADIVIVGAGAAGITLARKLKPTGASILLVESGGADYNKAVQDLYNGQNTGEDYYDLRESRLRFFGGTTAIWGGRCAQLDEIDFEKRSWVDHSGWPVSKNDLAPYYRDAQKELEVPATSDNTMPGFDDPLKNGRTTTAFWQFDEKFARFTLPSCDDLTSADNVRVLLNATMTDAQTSENGRRVETITIRNLNGGQAQISAQEFVLAMGGLEIPRMLLAMCPDGHPDGIGNNTGQVGRYFMEHPHGRGARIYSDRPKKLFETFPAYMRDDKGDRYGLLIRPSEQTQKQTEILNTCFTIGVYRHPGQAQEFYKKAYHKAKHDMAPSSFGRGMWQVVKRASRWVQDRIGPSMKTRMLKNPKFGIYAVLRAEQAPNPDSRVVLSTEKDALGVPKIDLDWQFLEIDKRSVRETMYTFGEDLERLGLGRVELMPWLDEASGTLWEFDDLVTSHVKGGYHHIGTARMGDDPKKSVVDADCKVHGVENLYIAGSSVFPTGGWANPTLTILALSLRLGDTLSARLYARRSCKSTARVA